MVAGASVSALRDVLEQVVILRALPAEAFQRLLGLALRIIEVPHPERLVIAGERWILLRDHGAHAVSAHHLRIGQMRDNLADAPFSGRGDKIFLLAEYA